MSACNRGETSEVLGQGALAQTDEPQAFPQHALLASYLACLVTLRQGGLSADRHRTPNNSREVRRGVGWAMSSTLARSLGATTSCKR